MTLSMEYSDVRTLPVADLCILDTNIFGGELLLVMSLFIIRGTEQETPL